MSVSVGPKPPPRGEDLPYDDGEPMETERHREQMWMLVDALGHEWIHRDDVYVAGNMALYFSETQARRNDFRAPDVFVVLDTQRRERKSWVVWEEEGRTPELIVELVSESTEKVDRGIKMDVYARLVHVPIYVLYDPFSAQLDVYALDLTTGRYRAMTPDARGYFWCARLGLFLGVVRSLYRRIDAPWLRFIREDGSLVPNAEERVASAEEHATTAEERATTAEERAAAAEERARRAEAELAKLRGGA